MTASTHTAERLTGLLAEQISGMQAVLESLEVERQALRQRDIEVLNQATALKERQLVAADALERRRRQIVPDPDAMEQLARIPVIGERWNQLLALTRQCREWNYANGMMIRWQQRRVEQTMNILRGAPGPPQIYGPDGENRQTGRYQKTLASV